MAGCLQRIGLILKSLFVLLSVSTLIVHAEPYIYRHLSGLDAESILVANNGIRVPFGRSVYLDPINDLVTEVQPGDHCHITVLDNGPLAQKPGMLTPKTFPCSFGAEEVKYTHFGSRSPSKDRVRLQLRYDSQTNTVVVPFMLEVELVFQQLEIVTRNIPLVVDKLNGQSNPIDKKGLEFTYEDEVTTCKVTTLIGIGGLPRYGKLLDNSLGNQMVDCNEFLKKGIRYQHTASTNSPNRDYIPMLVEVQDKEGNIVQQEHFQIMVRIKEGSENNPPKPSFVAMMMMEIDQFVMTAITSDMLAAEDVESDPDDLIFNITSPMGPQLGYIISTDDQNLPITSFCQRDIKDLKIAYKPPSDDSDTERIIQIEFEVIDTEGSASDTFAFMVVVKPMNTLAPVATKNTGQLLFEGQSRPLSSEQNLRISDEDNLENVKIFVADGLKHGELAVLGSLQKFFTAADLDAGIVVYQHDGSDTYSDNIIFKMTDGSNEVEFLFPITIVPIDDEPPIINANTGIVLSKKEIIQISPFILSATDIDSEDKTIKFMLEPPYSKIGEIVLRQVEHPTDPSAWKFTATNEMFERVVTEWFQQDILEGKLFYRHNGPHSTTTVTDHLLFRVQDDNDPPNQSGEHVFTAKIYPVDDLPPELYPGTSLQMTVKEYELTTFKKKFLHYTDLDSDDRDLKYIITKPPTDTTEDNAVALGNIVLTDSPDAIITEFTQAQINHHKVAYKPPDLELGITPKVLQFNFKVEDTATNSVDGQFTIFLQPVDNKPPNITNTGFTVLERSIFIISKKELDASDQDTEDENIVFTLTQTPKYGQLQYLGAEMINGGSFSLNDIESSHLTYLHSGEESLSDVIKLEVSDGFHEVPIIIKISVNPVDDERPTFMLPKGLLGASLDVLENGATEITNNIIQGHDEDTDDLMLTFIVEEPPKLGEIIVNGAPAERFTQEDIINGVVIYAHTSGEIGPVKEYDSFNLTISDMSDEWVVGGNKVQGVRVLVTILPMDSIPPVVSVGEQFVVVEGEKNIITLEHIQAEDLDTDNDEILCTITVHCKSGYIENISPAPGSEKSRAGLSVTAFSIKDVSLGHIYYVQSIHKGVEPKEDRFTFRCSDGINFSDRHSFPIIIIPANDEKPQIFTHDFVVMEGMSLVIDTPILNAADLDIPDDNLEFEIIKSPKHGSIVQQLSSGTIPVLKFSPDQIKEASNIAYEHDDSESKEDSFEIRLSDGKYSVEKKIPITIIPVDDETPRMTINDGLEVEIGEAKVINNRVLKAEDLDSEDKELTYIIRYGPVQGYIQRLTKHGDVTGNITIGMNFTQEDIDQNLIQYVHKGQEGVRDLLKFDVTDGLNPLIDRYFYINIGSTDIVFPDVINKGVTLREGGKVTLTTDLLSTTDMNSPDEFLTFSITRAPSKGHLECSDLPGVPISTFTQLQLAGNKIYYIHTSDDEVKMDSFEFEVTDGYNPVFRTFRVSITDVDNKKPILTIHKLVVGEGEIKLITPFELTVEDRDTADHLLRFVITQVPVHGQLLFNRSQPITSFTKQDLNENLITYHHDGTDTSEDSFSFTVTDGTHTQFYVFPDTAYETLKPQTMTIQINTIDNGVPQIVVNKAAPTLKTLHTGHLGFLITNKALRAEDSDSPKKVLRYTVSEAPLHGFIINTALGNDSIKTFTQADIDDMKICYVLRDRSNATSDIFYFTVEDKGANKLKPQPFRLNWAWISLDKEFYLVDEDAKFLEVTLKRRGYLGETSFVSIATKDGTAEKDKDFKGKSQKQVQFNPGQTRATWRVKIFTDQEFETSETFEIQLSEPVMAVLEFPDTAIVEIVDPGDESTVFIPQAEYHIEEDIGELLVPVHRSGDVSQELMVICYTQQGSAIGTTPTSVLSYSDYITRPEDHNSVLRFDKDEREKACRIIIIDDSLYEEEESFNVSLSMPMGGQVGTNFPSARVVILADSDDEPSLFFGETGYTVDESSGYVEIRVWRTGTDLSKTATVMVRSRKSEPVSAEAGVDYVGISRNLDFAPGVTMQTFRVTILDDLGQPQLEGPETFDLVLRMPMNAVLGEPSRTTITINDTVTDLPKVQFKEGTYIVDEADGEIRAMLYRSGDISLSSTVRCYTRQGSAQVMMDYEERPNAAASIITFLPGESDKPCIVKLMEDSIHEEDEEFRLVLGTPTSKSPYGATLGEQKETIITITDHKDKPIIQFSENKYSVKEPQVPGQVVVLLIPVLRLGDTSKVSLVRVHTKDGSATSGEDYNPVSQEMEFKEGEQEHFVEVQILYDGKREIREAFTVHLKPDEYMVAETQMSKAIVYIEEMDTVADVTFPAVPQVVSLLIYDDTAQAKDHPQPPHGYPVVCVTACNPKYSDFDKTGSICSVEHINNTLTQYRWLVSAPSGKDGVTSPMRELDTNTFFTNSKSITLDSIYFQAGSRVQCAARAFNANGDAGLELSSPIVTISRQQGMCQPRIPGTVGAEPFSAKIRYTGPDDPDFPNLIKLTVIMPHMDGMLPIISTRPLSNFELTLSPDGTRVGNHRCSNLLDFNEIQTGHGFITDATKNPEIIGETSPYQYSVAMRSTNSLRFYRNLNLEACLWEFNSYYDMSELLNTCGGSVGTDGQVLNLVQSYVTLRVPLFISYVFHSPVAVGGWQHFDLQSELRLTFVYDTAILWQEGIGSPPEAELQGAMYPTSMRINEEGRLVVYFKTEARFRGQFVLSHPGTSLTSMVMSVDHPELTFMLSLVRTEPTYNQPMQQWSFVSDFAIRDYSGTYSVKLIPCTSSPAGEFSIPPVCHPREPLTFDMDIRFQQVSDPVSAEFSLNTQMYLLSKKDLWLSDGFMGFGEGTDAAFTEGSPIYGRVMVDPVQNLGDSFSCSIEKVFLCTGTDGYIPKYNPPNKEFGCLADAPSLLYRFKILDKAQPETQATSFGDVRFDATLALDTPGALPLVRQPGSDGFTLSSAPLFQVAAGREWFIHAIYTVRSSENANRGKRSLEYQHSLSVLAQDTSGWQQSQQRRTVSDPDIQAIGSENSRGTNIQHIALARSDRLHVSQKQPWAVESGVILETPLVEGSLGKGPGITSVLPTGMVTLLGFVGLLLLVCVVVLLILVVRQKQKKKACPPYSTSSSAAYDNNTSLWQHSDSSEV
ncbi:FRAS1-related extracellular matrix protein 3 isoform X1 [Denticeps clupeoides]|uniref:Calx-beta domain-containing protein n=1 Tax=Denticeps clupeoides TaxID=299321 RepID=A0AAY4D1D2_9TELE|nr:FRAS1-related extracellular matrix protein 2-like isoform X1 [Denticeps clupeoides]